MPLRGIDVLSAAIAELAEYFSVRGERVSMATLSAKQEILQIYKIGEYDL